MFFPSVHSWVGREALGDLARRSTSRRHSLICCGRMAATLGLGTALLVGAGTSPAWALADPAPMVAGVSEVVSPGAPGPILPL